MVFKPRQKRQTLDINLEISQSEIVQIKETVFLGVILDEKFAWKPDILNVVKTISKSTGIIYKASFFLPTSYLCTLYFNLVYPNLVYCISIWGSTYPSNLNRIFLLQKKVLRIISRSAFDAHTESIFKQLKILKLSDIYRDLKFSKFFFSFKEGLLPDAFNEMFLLTNQIHHYNTRNSNTFYLFSCRPKVRQFAVRFQGPKLFNSFNTEIQNADSFSKLKSKLKTLLLN